MSYRAVLAGVLLLLAWPVMVLSFPVQQLMDPPPAWPLPVMGAFTPPTEGVVPAGKFEGVIRLAMDQAVTGTRVHRDDYKFAERPEMKFDRLPAIEFHFVQDRGELIPAERVSAAGGHPLWEYVLGVGRVWENPEDAGYARATMPFNLRERNADCVHNGVLTFLLRADGAISNAAFLLASETCLYNKFDLWGHAPASYLPASVPGRDGIVRAHRTETAARLETHPVASLAEQYPGADPAVLANAGHINPEDMSAYGFVVNGMHYLGVCETRRGPYPFCEELVLPSYSTAKSLFAGLALMRLEKLYPGAADQRISDLVEDCARAGNWRDVRLIDALTMATGNFMSPDAEVDEASPAVDREFFLQEVHQGKIQFSCNAWPRRAKPGTHWVYHTTDTYVLGTAMNRYLRDRAGAERDIFDDLILPLWEPLNLSEVTRHTRRTYDAAAQPWVGFGLMYLPGDIARLANALNQDFFGSQLDAELFAQAMQGADRPRGLVAMGSNYYSNGFWAYDIGTSLGCAKPLWVPYMSGFGGIAVVLLPNETVYYHFSDSDVHRWLAPVRELHRLEPLC